MFQTIVTVILTAGLTLGLLALYIRRTLPNILEEVALGVSESISEQLKEAFTEPNVKKAFSILGKQSGEVRANSALREKAADKILEGIPSIKMVLDRLDITPTEGLQLLQDPLVGPFIQNFLTRGAAGLMKGVNPKASGQYRSKF